MTCARIEVCRRKNVKGDRTFLLEARPLQEDLQHGETLENILSKPGQKLLWTSCAIIRCIQCPQNHSLPLRTNNDQSIQDHWTKDWPSNLLITQARQWCWSGFVRAVWRKAVSWDLPGRPGWDSCLRVGVEGAEASSAIHHVSRKARCERRMSTFFG